MPKKQKPKKHHKFLSPKLAIPLIAALIAVLVYAFWAIQIDKPKQSTSKAATCSVNVALVTPCRPLLAVASGKYPSPVGADVKSQTLDHERRITIPGSATTKQVDGVKVYHTAGQVLNNEDTFFATRANTFLMLNWKPATNWTLGADVNNATVNQQIDAMGNSIKAIGDHKVFLTIWHEPENDATGGGTCSSYKGSAGTAAQYVAMWHHVRARFDALSVSNVVWDIDYMNYPPWNCIWQQLYPGDGYVDWITFNAYGTENSPNFVTNVNHFYNQLKDPNNNASGHQYLTKHWGIAEWSDTNMNATDGPAYFDQATKSLTDGTFPLLKLYMVFDDVGPEGNENRVAYTNGVLNPTAMQAYRNFANSTAFGGTTAPPPKDTTPPTVSVSSPTNGTTISGTVTVSATANDNVGVTDVKLWVDGTLLKDDTNGSDGWSVSWDTATVPNGSHTMKAVALDAAGNSATATSAVVVNNAAAPIINSFTANPASVANGGKTTLTWATSNTTGCSVSPGGPTNTTATSWQSGALTTTTTFTLSCSGKATVTKTLVVTVPPNPTISSFKASPTSITVGSSSTLSWATANTASCSVTPGGPTNTTTTSWQTLAMTTTGTKTYTLTCQNNVGTSVSATTSFVVNAATLPPSSVKLSASSTAITTGGTVTLSWTSVGATSCTLDPGSFTASGTTSSKTITNLRSTTTYVATCSNNAGATKSNNVTVTVSAAPTPPPAPVIISFTATPSSIQNSGTSVLAWQTSNVVTGGCNLNPSSLTSTSSDAQWTTPPLTASISYTLTCKNSANVTTSKSVSITVAGKPAPPPPPPTPPAQITTGSKSSSSSSKVQATTGQTVTNTQATPSVDQGSLATLDPSTVDDSAEVGTIAKVEFYNGQQLIQTVTKAPFALNTRLLKPGSYTITQRTYFKDGSTLQKSQLVSVVKKSGPKSTVWLVVGVGLGVMVLAAALAGIYHARRLAHKHHFSKNKGASIGEVYGDPDLAGITPPPVSKPHVDHTRPKSATHWPWR